MAITQYTRLQQTEPGSPAWSNLEKIAFRFAFIFLLLLIVPLEWKWYETLFSLNLLYSILNYLANNRPDLLDVASESGRWGFLSYTSWWAAAGIAILGSAVWTILSRGKQRRDYNVLYYWLRVIVRYRIAIGLIAFGFVKFFPMQMPFPSLANLHTDFGDYAPFKLYWQIVGISFRYESFLGFVEITAGLLMLFRPTVAIGAIVNAGVLFNVAHANLGYDGGVHVYASYFVLLSLFLLLPYLPNIWKLFFKGEAVKPVYYYPDFSASWKKISYFTLKALFIFFFLFYYGYARYDRIYINGRLKEPVVPGLSQAAGFYNVSSFVLNGDTLAYSPRDSVRWHSAVFERYSTLVFKTNKDINIDLGNGGPGINDLLKNYEFTGRAGGKTYLYYEIDSVERKLYLVDKNQKFPRALIRRLETRNDAGLKELYEKPIRDEINILRWDYERPTTDRIRISGIDANQDSITVVLDRIDQAYLTGKEWYIENHKYNY